MFGIYIKVRARVRAARMSEERGRYEVKMNEHESTQGNAEDISRELRRTSLNLGHDGFVYFYIQGGRVKVVGDVSVAALAPMFLDILTKKIMR